MLRHSANPHAPVGTGGPVDETNNKSIRGGKLLFLCMYERG